MPQLPPIHRPFWSKKRDVELARRRSKKRQYATNSSTWRKLRARQLAQEPLCCECSKEGKLTPANTVDHMDGNSYNNAPNNLQSLCAPCHARLTVKHDGAFGNPISRRGSDDG
jgi:5-methylcytosine-specific restriction protein A